MVKSSKVTLLLNNQLFFSNAKNEETSYDMNVDQCYRKESMPSTAILDTVTPLWAHEVCAQISPQVTMCVFYGFQECL